MDAKEALEVSKKWAERVRLDCDGNALFVGDWVEILPGVMGRVAHGPIQRIDRFVEEAFFTLKGSSTHTKNVRRLKGQTPDREKILRFDPCNDARDFLAQLPLDTRCKEMWDYAYFYREEWTVWLASAIWGSDFLWPFLGPVLNRISQIDPEDDLDMIDARHYAGCILMAMEEKGLEVRADMLYDLARELQNRVVVDSGPELEVLECVPDLLGPGSTSRQKADCAHDIYLDLISYDLLTEEESDELENRLFNARREIQIWLDEQP